MKDSFILYTENRKQINMLTREQRGDLLEAIFAYADGEEPAELDPVTEMAFSFIRDRLDRDAVKYEEICEKRRENGRIGGEASASKRKQVPASATKSKQVQHDNDPDNDPDNDAQKSESDIARARGELGNVLLTDEELDKLNAEYGPAKVTAAIVYLDGYIPDKGYKVKSKTHYLAIRRWVIDAVEEQEAKRRKNASAPPGNATRVIKHQPMITREGEDLDALQRRLVKQQRDATLMRAADG